MRVYKFRLYPTKKQEEELFTQLNLCRFTYNQDGDYVEVKKVK